MLPAFDYHAPQSLAEALALAAEHGDDARLLGGGTALVLLMRQGLLQPEVLIALRHVPDLRRVAANGELRLGSTVSHLRIETDAAVRQRWPLVAEAYHHVATPRVRAQATVGGGLVHGDPNQDPPPALLALDARVRLVSQGGEREVGLAEFFVDYYETAIEPGEILAEVIVPTLPERSGWGFHKFVPRSADDYSVVTSAAVVTLDAEGRVSRARLALGSVGATPLVSGEAERALVGQTPTPALLAEAAEAVRDLVDPVDDLRGPAEYKRKMAVVFARRALESALERASAS